MEISVTMSEYTIVPILLWGLETMYAHCHLYEVGFYGLKCEWHGYYPEISKEQE